jgi:hypothetical protein
MYACLYEIRADFSRGCAHPAMQPPIPTTHPTTQRTRTGAPLPGLRPEEEHAPPTVADPLLHRTRDHSEMCSQMAKDGQLRNPARGQYVIPNSTEDA